MRLMLVERGMGLKELGEYLKKVRLARGWTQTYAAREAGVEQSQLSRIERATGTSFPDPDVIERLATLYGVSPNHLMRIAGYAWGESAVAQNTDDDVLVYTMREHHRDLTPYQRQIIQMALDDAARRRREQEGQ